MIAPSLVAIAVAAGSPVERAVERARDVATCEAIVASAPEDLDAYRCYPRVARRAAAWDEAVASVGRLLAADPGNDRARLALGWLEVDLYRPGASERLSEVAASFASKGDVRGEVLALTASVPSLLDLGRWDEAARTVEKLRVAAERAGDPVLVAASRARQISLAQSVGDASGTQELLATMREDLPDAIPYWLAYEVVVNAGGAAWGSGRLEEARGWYLEGVRMAEQAGDRWAEASSRYNAVLMSALDPKVTFDPPRRAAMIAEMREAVAAAVAGGNRENEARSRLLLSQARELPIEEQVAHARRAVEIVRAPALSAHLGFASRTLAFALLRLDEKRHRGEAEATVERSLERARAVGNVDEVVQSLVARGSLARMAGDDAGALAADLAAIDAVEQLRDLQRDDLVRGRSLWRYAGIYARCAGFLLGKAGDPADPSAVAQAFEIEERLRARAFLDALDAAGAAGNLLGGGPERERLDAALARSRAIRRALELGSSAGVADALRASDLEVRELRTIAARIWPRRWILDAERLATLDEVRGALAPDQAFVSYLVADPTANTIEGPWRAVSWLVVVTRDRLTVTRVTDRRELAEKVAMFRAVLERRDAFEPDAAAAMYAAVGGAGLDALPAGIRRLVIVPDGPLHRLPFGALRSAPGQPPLERRFEITVAPSATTWLRGRSGNGAPLRDAVLILAGPTIRTAPEGAATRVGGDAAGTLPHAASEGRAVLAALGGRGRLATGAEATDSLLLAAKQGDYGWVHLAAHAVVDDADARKTAVLLAPAGDGDGRLDLKRIVGLDLDGAVVVLTACSSAGGEILDGEGIAGLARAFLQAGARAVVGGLWPLRDDEAASLAESFAREAARGRSLSEALAAARRERLDAGRPTHDWAGIVLIGDGDAVWPKANRRGPWRAILLAVAGLAALVALRRALRPA